MSVFGSDALSLCILRKSSGQKSDSNISFWIPSFPWSELRWRYLKNVGGSYHGHSNPCLNTTLDRDYQDYYHLLISYLELPATNIDLRLILSSAPRMEFLWIVSLIVPLIMCCMWFNRCLSLFLLRSLFLVITKYSIPFFSVPEIAFVSEDAVAQSVECTSFRQ